MAFRFNGGNGAITCDVCSIIIKEPAVATDQGVVDLCPKHIGPKYGDPYYTGDVQNLIDRGFISVSNKYRTVVRIETPHWSECVPREWLGTWFEEEMRRLFSQNRRFWAREHDAQVERYELTEEQWRLWKALGGHSA